MTKHTPEWKPFYYGNKFTVAHNAMNRADPFRSKTLAEAQAEADRRNAKVRGNTN